MRYFYHGAMAVILFATGSPVWSQVALPTWIATPSCNRCNCWTNVTWWEFGSGRQNAGLDSWTDVPHAEPAAHMHAWDAIPGSDMTVTSQAEGSVVMNIEHRNFESSICPICPLAHQFRTVNRPHVKANAVIDPPAGWNGWVWQQVSYEKMTSANNELFVSHGPHSLAGVSGSANASFDPNVFSWLNGGSPMTVQFGLSAQYQFASSPVNEVRYGKDAKAQVIDTAESVRLRGDIYMNVNADGWFAVLAWNEGEITVDITESSYDLVIQWKCSCAANCTCGAPAPSRTPTPGGITPSQGGGTTPPTRPSGGTTPPLRGTDSGFPYWTIANRTSTTPPPVPLPEQLESNPNTPDPLRSGVSGTGASGGYSSNH